MELNVSEKMGKVKVTVLGIKGELDGSNYQTLIEKARSLVRDGASNLILDMSECGFMSSAGLVALHSIALLMRGQEPPDPEQGWAAIHSMSREKAGGGGGELKLLNPQPPIVKTLQKTGMDKFFMIYDDLEKALASF